MTKRKPKLTDKQKLFAEYYAECLNGTQAARLAGYKGNDNALAVMATKLLRNAKVKIYIDELLAERKLSALEVLARISEQATATLEDFVDTGELEGMNTINLAKARKAGKLHLLKEVKVTHGKYSSSLAIKLHDQQNALALLAKHHGLLVTKYEIRDWRQKARAAGVEDPDSLFENAKREYEKSVKGDDG